jgi:hypothetical protein
MNEEIAKFIKNEKEIAEYKLSLLRASKRRGYTNRLISMEEEYIEFDFESIGFDTIEEAREALILFRIDRPMFNNKYSTVDDGKRASASQVENLSKRISFLSNSYKMLIEDRISSDEIDSYVAAIVGKSSGAIFEKAKARIQIIICSLSRHIFVETKNLREKISDTLTRGQAVELKKIVDSLYESSIYEVFKYYNDSIDQTYSLLNSNKNSDFILSIYPLTNLLDKYSEDSFKIERMLNVDKNFFSKTGRPISRKSTERGWGIKTPLNRVGNETTEVLYRTIYCNDDTCLDKILERGFYNARISEGEYVKAISTKPVWNILADNLDDSLALKMSDLLGINLESISASKLSDPEKIKAINLSNNVIDIDSSRSKILIAATRSEASKLNEAKSYIELLIKELKEEYDNEFCGGKNTVDKQGFRRDKIKEIIGSIVR